MRWQARITWKVRARQIARTTDWCIRTTIAVDSRLGSLFPIHLLLATDALSATGYHRAYARIALPTSLPQTFYLARLYYLAPLRLVDPHLLPIYRQFYHARCSPLYPCPFGTLAALRLNLPDIYRDTRSTIGREIASSVTVYEFPIKILNSFYRSLCRVGLRWKIHSRFANDGRFNADTARGRSSCRLEIFPMVWFSFEGNRREWYKNPWNENITVLWKYHSL